jgi:hypothetical protein
MDFLSKSDRSVLLATSFALVGSALALFVTKLWRARMFFRELQKRGMVRSIFHSLVLLRCRYNAADAPAQLCVRSSDLPSEHLQAHSQRFTQDALLRGDHAAGLCQAWDLLCGFLAVQRAVCHGYVADVGDAGDSDQFENIDGETASTEALVRTSGRWAQSL